MEAPARHDDELPLPVAEGNLRETFDLPLMTEADGGPTAGTSKPQTSDALALFDSGPPSSSRRRTNSAEGRSRARRCPTCGGVVPVGMSLCQSCGLDLETGNRIDLVEDLVPVAGPARSSGMPVGVMLLGGICLLASLVLGLIAVALSVQGGEVALGYQLLSLVCGFGVYASVQFLRGRSVRLLAVAMALGAVIAVIGLIVMPIYQAQIQDMVAVEVPGQFAPADEETGVAPPLTEHFPINQVSWGIGVLLAYAAASVYLNSPPVRRFLAR